HTPLAVIEWDLDFRVASWNPAAERIFGYSRAEAIGQHASFTVPPNFREHVDRVWHDLLAQRGGARSTNDNITKDGRTISCEWYNTPLVDDSGRVLGVASLVQDVTERVVLEDRLRQSQKMEAVGRLAGGVAHDFNNLLTVILGYTQLLMDGLPPGSRLAEGTAQIKSAADRAAGITRQLLAFSRKQVRSPRLIDLNNVMLNLDTMLRRLIGEDIEVLTVPATDLGTVKADPGQIEQVLMNLALNARDAMPSGGKLTLETSNVQLDEAYSHEHRPVEPGRYVMLAVSDTGVGMSPETLAHIFEPFYTTKEPGKGTGLGLSTVYGVVKASGGYVWVYSELGQGTTFKIYLPRVDQPAQPLSAENRPSGIQRGTETILLVEDDPQLNQLASSVLAHCGYKVLAAANPEEGLAVCRTHPHEIHLLVTDVVMPKMNGRQLAEQVARIRPSVKLLYVSGYTGNAIVHYGVLDAGLWFLPKPFSLAALVAKVREVLDAPGDGRSQETGG
ncbi:MAG: ATP-binding protein, partial [Candidatus Sulfotelmatobacter sp.]